jgi:molybdenum cofactor cytidylyltransferase
MGQNKLLLPFRGKAILQHVIDAALRAALSPLILVLGPDGNNVQEGINSRSTLVINTASSLGNYGTSLHTGLRALETHGQFPGAMFLLGDQPLLTTASINALINAFQTDPTRWIAPSWRGQRGNPVITPASWFDEIYALKGDEGPRKHLKNPAARLQLVDVEDEGVIFDIDSPEDYEHLLKRD